MSERKALPGRLWQICLTRAAKYESTWLAESAKILLIEYAGNAHRRNHHNEELQPLYRIVLCWGLQVALRWYTALALSPQSEPVYVVDRAETEQTLRQGQAGESCIRRLGRASKPVSKQASTHTYKRQSAQPSKQSQQANDQPTPHCCTAAVTRYKARHCRPSVCMHTASHQCPPPALHCTRTDADRSQQRGDVL